MMTTKSKLNLIGDLNNLIESFTIDDINTLIEECESYVIQIIILNHILEIIFDKKQQSIKSQLKILTQKKLLSSNKPLLTENLTETKLFLKNRYISLVESIGHEKQVILDSIGTFQNMSNIVGINIKDNVSALTELLNEVSTENVEIDSIFKSDKPNYELMQSEFRNTFIRISDELTKLYHKIRKAFPSTIDPRLVESILREEGIPLNNIDEETLNELVKSDFSKYLMISLNTIDK